MTYFLSFLFISFSVRAIAQTYNGAVATATGGAGVAVADIVDGAFMNPATIPLFARKQASVSYAKDRLAVILADNGKDALFPAAIGYEQTSGSFYKNKIYHLVLAYPIQVANLSLGLNYEMNDLKWQPTDVSYKQNRIGAGVIWQPLKELTFGATYQNKALNDTDLPDEFDQATSTSVGFAWVYQSFAQFRVDVESMDRRPAGRFIYKFGIETYVNDWIITRFGYRNDNITSQNFGTVGVGFAGPQFGLHYAYQSEANNQTDPQHIVDLSVPF